MSSTSTLDRELEELFLEWKRRPIHQGEVFISDGAIDPTRWITAKPKVLFLTKEAYSGEDKTSDWDLCYEVREVWKTPKYKYWWTIGYWALALRETSTDRLAEFPPYLEQIDPRQTGVYEEAKNAVMNSAVVNIKKSGGESSSKVEDLRRYVDSDADLLARQIALLEPDIILCGNTFDLLRERFWSKSLSSEGHMVYRDNDSGALVIDYWHPANQYPNSVMFYALAAVYQSALKRIGVAIGSK